MMRPLLFCVLLLLTGRVSAQHSFTNLLPGRSLHHWMTESGRPVREGWAFDDDGTLHLQGRGGHIVTRCCYTDFELWFEFRISEGGNSGIKYRVRRYGDSLLGCEFQILDDAAFPDLSEKNKTASLYDVFAPRTQPVRVRPAGEFNVGRIVVRGQRLKHWINGQLTVDERAGSRRWRQHIQQSKFRDRRGFGCNRTGRIMLTDHHSEVWYRNVFIRPL